MRFPRLLAVIPVALVCLVALAPGAGAKSTPADVQRGLEGLVTSPGGPPGAVATIYRDGKLTTLRAGRADIKREGAPRASDHMRIASIAKAFSGAVALNLVRAGKLGLDDTIAQRLPGAPTAWGAVTIRQLLNHTSGVPDYTRSKPSRNRPKRIPAATSRRRPWSAGSAATRSSSRPGRSTSTRTPTTSSSA